MAITYKESQLQDLTEKSVAVISKLEFAMSFFQRVFVNKHILEKGSDVTRITGMLTQGMSSSVSMASRFVLYPGPESKQKM